MVYLIWGAVGIVTLISLYLGWRANMARQEAIMAFCVTDGWEYLGDTLLPNVQDLRSIWPFSKAGASFSTFGAAADERMKRCACKRVGDLDLYAFDYWVTTGSGRDRETSSCGVILVRVPMTFMPLQISPAGFLTHIAEHLGLEEIKFESDQFNQRYRVTCDNKKFAYDILCPQVLEHLLRIQPLHWQFIGFYIVITRPTFFAPDEIRRITVDAEEILRSVPDYVRKEIGFTPTWTGPLDGVPMEAMLDANL